MSWESLTTSCHYKHNATKLYSGGYMEDLGIKGKQSVKKVKLFSVQVMKA
jgi:hypothetical protein